MCYPKNCRIKNKHIFVSDFIFWPSRKAASVSPLLYLDKILDEEKLIHRICGSEIIRISI